MTHIGHIVDVLARLRAEGRERGGEAVREEEYGDAPARLGSR